MTPARSKPDLATFTRLRDVPLFSGLSDDHLGAICRDVRTVRLAAGQMLFHEGDPGDVAYLIVSGDVEILKASVRRDVLLSVRTGGDMIGEMSLLQPAPRNASARARTDVELLAIPRPALDELLDVSPTASRAIFTTFLGRERATHDQLRQSERMVQLGTFTAGIAHELNNPAAAVTRGTMRLADLIAELGDLLLPPAVAQAVVGLTTVDRRAQDSLERGDLEDELEHWLEEQGIEDAWRLAPELADLGASTSDLEHLAGSVPPGEFRTALRTVVAAAALRDVANEIAEGTSRISSIVRSLKSYSYLDQSPVQDVDVHQGVEDTLVLLSHKLRHVHVVRDFAPELPTISALGTELNQVWTNLIDNACDALEDVTDRIPTLTLRTRVEDGMIAVEVEDNGPGIPADVRQRIFDAFFTTKPPGKGTGLGLQISYRIVVLEHGGDMIVDSVPGRTVFRVLLPLELPQEPSQEAAVTTNERCEHLESLHGATRPEGGCPDCLELGDTWVNLRYCDTCGRIGCCDDSKNRHARAHAEASGHPVIRSLEPGEHWAWCMVDNLGIDPAP